MFCCNFSIPDCALIETTRKFARMRIRVLRCSGLRNDSKIFVSEVNALPLDSPEVHNAKIDGWTRLFMYVQAVAKEIGEEKALKILSDIQTQEMESWFRENAVKLNHSGSPLLAAYRMMFEDLLGRNLSEIDIVEQSEERIVHHYTLPCSMLDACLKLGLDTRKICKALHQESANTLMQLVDPRLRFDRDYKKIRPHTEYCVEMFWLGE